MNGFKKILFALFLVGGLVGLIVLDVVYAVKILYEVKWYVFVPLFIAGFAVTSYIGIFMHEAGHLIFGLAAGMRFKSIRLPFLKIYESGGKIRVGKCDLGSVLGSCEMYPTGDIPPARAFILEALGGPVGSFTALLLSVAFLLQAPYISPYPAILFGFAHPVLYCVFLENAFPVSVRGARTDGGQIVELMSGTPSAKALLAALTAQAMFAAGKTPSEVPYEVLFEVPQLPDDDANYILLLNTKYLYALDRADFEAVRDIDMRLKDVLPSLPPVYADQIRCDAFYNSLFIAPDHDFVAANVKAVFETLSEEDDVTACRIRGYYCLYREDFTGAYVELHRGRELVSAYPLEGIAKMELRLLDELEDEITVSAKASFDRKEG